MRKIVHHIDGQPYRPRPGRHHRSSIACARANDRNDAGEVGIERIAIGKFDSLQGRGLNTAHIVIAIGRVPANSRAGRYQQTQFRPRQIASANQQHRTCLQIEEYRQESHAMLGSPEYGVDWHYFLYMSSYKPATRKTFLLHSAPTIEVPTLEAKAHRSIFPRRQRRSAGPFGLT